jgi:hypothetical protein
LSTRFGISSGGRSAEALFRQLTGAREAPTAALGDAVLVDSQGHPHLVEVKNATKVTVNQVRAVKYLPVVVYHEPTGWYVVPAHGVIALVATKTRGQHTENPFESATLNVNQLGHFRVPIEADLNAATLAAITEADRYPELREVMAWVLKESRSLARESRDKVSAILARLQL